MEDEEGRKSLPREVPSGFGPRDGSPGRRLSGSAAKVLACLRSQPRPATITALAARERQEPHGRGRPGWCYEATAALTEASEYASLDVALSSALAHTSARPSRDKVAGVEWGRELARGRGAAPTTATAARARAVELLEAAHRNPGIVCSVHLGMPRGVLAEYGADATASALEPFAEPGACRVVIPPTERR